MSSDIATFEQFFLQTRSDHPQGISLLPDEDLKEVWKKIIYQKFTIKEMIQGNAMTNFYIKHHKDVNVDHLNFVSSIDPSEPCNLLTMKMLVNMRTCKPSSNFQEIYNSVKFRNVTINDAALRHILSSVDVVPFEKAAVLRQIATGLVISRNLDALRFLNQESIYSKIQRQSVTDKYDKTEVFIFENVLFEACTVGDVDIVKWAIEECRENLHENRKSVLFATKKSYDLVLPTPINMALCMGNGGVIDYLHSRNLIQIPVNTSLIALCGQVEMLKKVENMKGVLLEKISQEDFDICVRNANIDVIDWIFKHKDQYSLNVTVPVLQGAFDNQTSTSKIMKLLEWMCKNIPDYFENESNLFEAAKAACQNVTVLEWLHRAYPLDHIIHLIVEKAIMIETSADSDECCRSIPCCQCIATLMFAKANFDNQKLFTSDVIAQALESGNIAALQWMHSNFRHIRCSPTALENAARSSRYVAIDYLFFHNTSARTNENVKIVIDTISKTQDLTDPKTKAFLESLQKRRY